jgi:hypothetical protein
VEWGIALPKPLSGIVSGAGTEAQRNGHSAVESGQPTAGA